MSEQNGTKKITRKRLTPLQTVKVVGLVEKMKGALESGLACNKAAEIIAKEVGFIVTQSHVHAIAKEAGITLGATRGRSRSKALTESFKGLREEVAKINDTAEWATGKIEQCRDRIADLEKRTANLQAQYDQVLSRLVAAEKDTADLRQRLYRMGAHAAEAHADIAEFKERFTRMGAWSTTVDARIASIESRKPQEVDLK